MKWILNVMRYCCDKYCCANGVACISYSYRNSLQPLRVIEIVLKSIKTADCGPLWLKSAITNENESMSGRIIATCWLTGSGTALHLHLHTNSCDTHSEEMTEVSPQFTNDPVNIFALTSIRSDTQNKKRRQQTEDEETEEKRRNARG